MLPRYFTATDVAHILGIDRKRVYEWRRAGLIRPALTKGEEQYDRAALARMAVLVALQGVLGHTSKLPAQIVRAHAPTIDAWLDDFAPAVIELRNGLARAVVEIPLANFEPAIRRVPM